jgi:hypothetical protein
MVRDMPSAPSSSSSFLDTRRELGAITYAPNVLGSRGPRKMQVLAAVLPRSEILLI